MLPIEKGCMAIIVNSKAGNDGKVVIVGEPISIPVGFVEINRWLVDRNDIKTTKGRTINHVGETQLMRIDGYKQEEETKTEELVK